MGETDSVCVHIEVCQTPMSRYPASEIIKELEKYLEQQKDLDFDTVLSDTVLPYHIKYIRICPNSEKVTALSDKVNKRFHIYQTWGEGPQVHSLSEENEDVPAALNWSLPNTEFEGLWETLVLEDGLKEKLMSYVQTTLLYSSKKVNSQIVHWNGVILLHGPPGTGKTSLCKALAQKLSIRLDSKYKTSQLIEINTHSLFSKWFSESAKLVSMMFATVKQWLQSDDHFVFILIDEAESLTHVRQSNGTEPIDSVRVVNALLTQIDQLQRYPNFLILATSNVTNIIDVAFADRADLKLFIPRPFVDGIYEILRSCIEELISCGLIKGDSKNFFKQRMSSMPTDSNETTSVIAENSKFLFKVSTEGVGLSGRALRKIPFLTSTRFINKETPGVMEFLEVMEKVVVEHKRDNEKFFNNLI